MADQITNGGTSPTSPDGKGASEQKALLYEQREDLNDELDLLDQKLKRLKRQKRTEYRAKERSRVEQEIQRIEEKRQQLDRQLEAIDRQLTVLGTRIIKEAEEEQEKPARKTYVPGYHHDIFVSFADVDDEPLYGSPEGWVTKFIKELRILLGRKLGSPEAFSLWSAHQLPGHIPATAELDTIVRNCATIIVILSPGYLLSDRCQHQTEVFLQMIKDRVRAESRVFVVELDQIEDEEYPSVFKDLGSYKFWVADREGKPPRVLGDSKTQHDETDYYERLNDLSHDLAKELTTLREIEQGDIQKRSTVSESQSTVFLAEVTDDLYREREGVKRYLSQYNVHVLPEKAYPRDPKAFQDAVRTDMANSDLFVQLLSDIPFKPFPDLSQGYVRCQYELAQKAGKPILQWRSSKLNMNTILDSTQKDFLQMETVLAVTLEEFKANIVQKVASGHQQEPKPVTKHPNKPLIYIHADQHDSGLSEKICQTLEDFGAECLEPMREGNPANIREYFEMFVSESDGLMLVYGNTTPTWVTAQELAMRKVLRLRKEPPKGLALYEGPPPQKKPVPFKLPGLLIIDCQNSFDDSKLHKFFDFIR